MADPTNPLDPRSLATLVADLDPGEQQQFFMRLFTLLSPAALPVLRAERVEVTDHRGRTRIVLGDLGGDPETFGIGVYDRQSSERITMALGEPGPCIAFALDGNDALVLGVGDPETTALRPGPYLKLLQPGTGVALGWRVDDEGGEVEFEGSNWPDVQSGPAGSDE